MWTQDFGSNRFNHIAPASEFLDAKETHLRLLRDFIFFGLLDRQGFVEKLYDVVMQKRKRCRAIKRGWVTE
jgi:hypothetical protein